MNIVLACRELLYRRLFLKKKSVDTVKLPIWYVSLRNPNAKLSCLFLSWGLTQINGILTKSCRTSAILRFHNGRPQLLQVVRTVSCLQNSLEIKLLSSSWCGFTKSNNPYPKKSPFIKFQNCIVNCIIASSYFLNN